MLVNEKSIGIVRDRASFLEIMQIALKLYAKTKDQKYLEYAKDFGKMSKELYTLYERQKMKI